MDEKNLMMSLLTKTLNKSDDEISELIYTKSEGSDELTLKEGADEILFGEVEQFVKRIKEGVKPKQELLENQYKRGQKETAEDFEKDFKNKFSFPSELRGIDLVTSYIQTLQDEKSKLTPDKIKLHPVYIDMEKRLKSEATEIYETGKTKLEEREKQYNKDKDFDQIKTEIRTILTGLNPVLEANPIVANNRIEGFINLFKEFDWEIAADGKHIPIKDGNRIEDAIGNVQYFPILVNNEAKKYFEFKKQEDKGSMGDTKSNGISTGSLTMPKTEAEYMTVSQKLPDNKSRQEYRTMYEKGVEDGVITKN